MANELEKVIAELLKPKTTNIGGETPERLEAVKDTLAVTDSATVTAASPERRVGFAIVGRTEAA